jgi:integrase
MNRVVLFNEDGSVKGRNEEIGTTKTPKSVRKPQMPDILVETLYEWKRYCEDNGIVSEFVFPSTDTGNMRTYSGLRAMLERFKKSHGYKDEGITLYTFRHTYATVLLKQKLNPRLVADAMGHVKTSTTMDIYASVFEEDHVEAANVLDDVYNILSGKEKSVRLAIV